MLSNNYLFAGHQFKFFIGKDYCHPYEEAFKATERLFSYFLHRTDDPFLQESNTLLYPFNNRDFREAGPMVIQWSYPEQIFYWRWANPSLFHIEALSSQEVLSLFLSRLVANIQTLCLEASPFVWIKGFSLKVLDEIKVFVGSMTNKGISWANELIRRSNAELWSYGVTLINPKTMKVQTHLPPTRQKEVFNLIINPIRTEQLGEFLIFKKTQNEQIRPQRIQCYFEKDESIFQELENQALMNLLLQNSNLSHHSKYIPYMLSYFTGVK
jgi:hypothetical protein